MGDGRRAGRGGNDTLAAAAAAEERGGLLCSGHGRRKLGVHVEAVQKRGANRAATCRHRRRHGPPVDPRVVALGRVQARVAIVAAQHQQPSVQLYHVVGGPVTDVRA